MGNWLYWLSIGSEEQGSCGEGEEVEVVARGQWVRGKEGTLKGRK